MWVTRRFFCKRCVGSKIVKEFGGLDILVNNVAEQHEVEDVSPNSPKSSSPKHSAPTSSASFSMAKHALKHMKKGASIINTASITAYRGHKTLLDYSATKGAIVTFTRSLSELLVKKGIRVNAVAPGPILDAAHSCIVQAKESGEARLQRANGARGAAERGGARDGFPASDDASYMTGQVLHPNGGTVVNG